MMRGVAKVDKGLGDMLLLSLPRCASRFEAIECTDNSNVVTTKITKFFTSDSINFFGVWSMQIGIANITHLNIKAAK